MALSKIFILNDKLTWNDHFQRIFLTASRRLYTIRALKSFVPKKGLAEVYNGFVMSVVMYAAPLFCKLPVSVTSQMKRLQKQAHRIICNESCPCHVIRDIGDAHKQAFFQAGKFFSSCKCSDYPLNHLVPLQLPATSHHRIPYCSTERRLN